MGFRFQRRIKLFPGVSINLSKSGVSTSIGAQGARITLGHGKTRTTVGVPGTGISYTDVSTSDDTGLSINGAVVFAVGALCILAWIFL